MSELPRVSLEEGEPEEGPGFGVFWRVLIAALVVPFALGLIAQVFPAALDAVLLPAVLFVVVLPLACFVAAFVQLVRGRRAEALGYLLGGLVGPVIGFGTCFAGFSI